MFVPLDAYLDVSNVHHASITGDKGGYVLKLEGGDASEAYRVVIHFDPARVQRRDVFVLEFSDKQPVETTYYRPATFE